MITYFIVQIQLDKDGEEVCRQNYAIKHNKRRVQRFVKHNITDIWETIFNYVCVEGIEDSICPVLADGVVYRQFYKFNRQLNKYEECEAPEIYKEHYCSLAF